MPHTPLRLAMPLAAALVALLTAGGALAAPRCMLAPPGQTQRIAVGGTGRPMLLHLPRGFDAQSPAPIVFLLHGSGGTGAGILAESRLAAAADRHGFIVAAPDAGIPAGKGFVWNIPGVPTTRGTVPGPHAASDTAYIETAIDRLVAAGCVDPARVYVTGLSGGGRSCLRGLRGRGRRVGRRSGEIGSVRHPAGESAQGDAVGLLEARDLVQVVLAVLGQHAAHARGRLRLA